MSEDLMTRGKHAPSGRTLLLLAFGMAPCLARPAWAGQAAAARSAPVGLPVLSAPLIDPALTGGISLSGGWAAPLSALPAAAVPSELALPKAAAPVPALPLGDSRSPFVSRPQSREARARALESARIMDAAAAPRPADGAREAEIRTVSAAAFDGEEVRAAGADPVDGGAAQPPSGVDGGAGNGGDGSGSGGPGNPNGGAPLSQLYPRVIFIQDVFTKPASDQTVEYLEKLANAGVHLVFLTWRPQKGPGSAEEILLSRMKQHRTNPILVVSFNGGKISLHGRAANPKSVIEDLGGFTPAHLEAFSGINAKLQKALALSEPLEEQALPSVEGAFSYMVELPQSVAEADLPSLRAKAIRRYNQLLKDAKLPAYKMAAHPENPRALMIQSMPLRFSLPRVYKALDGQFHAEDLLGSPDKFLILADSRKSPKFSSSFPKKAEVQVVSSEAAVEEVLGAVLDIRRLPTVSLKLGKLRQYVEYWEPSRRFVADGEGGGGGGGYRGASKGDRETNQKFAMYTGTVLYQLMAWTYEQIFRGQEHNARLPVLQDRLRKLWYNPWKYGVHVNKPLAKAMKSKAWKAMQHGYLNYANTYLTNYYLREFGDFSAAVRNIQSNYVGLATDRKNLITLEFVSASTKKLYKIHTRIPRVMAHDTADGRTLVAYSYRTGKETPDDGEELLARILAMALLKGHARKGPDGKWHHGSPDGPVIGKLRVQLEYRTSHRSRAFDPEEFLRLEEGQVVQGPLAQEITSAIEREEADQEYQAYWEEQEQVATKKDMKTAKKKPAAKSKASARKTAAKTAAKPSRRTTKRGR